ncbi:Fic family protein [Allochromatium humboldtianum]|uniref:Fic family protein n=1 Tax=Allochromatium humboldtianum TaxID=504901 RepID=A0A850R8Q3_9GAMM|nr:Fic family protein [Allochromatium humboldtianum]NVZ11079.1 Fic family protein [Allochromatium humboldtianum]
MPHTWIWESPDWPEFRWDAVRIAPCLARARLAQGKVLGAARWLDADLTLEAVAAILVEDGLTTSAIEGEQLDLEAVRSSVARHLGLPTAGLPVPPRAVDGLIDVLLDAVQRHDVPLSVERLFGWQAALFPTGYSGLHAIRVGTLRGDEPMQVVSGAIGRERVHFIAPPRDGLETRLGGFLDWFNATPDDLDGLVRAGLAHLWFITLHPFEDGNGRLARAITDMALAQDEGPPMRLFSLSAQIQRERAGYYAILECTQCGGLDVTEWLAWFLAQVEAAATAAEQTVANTLAKARFWLRHQATVLNERQRKVLNRLLDAGPDGFAGGMNTRKYMGLTKTSRATAYRELADLVEKDCLRPTGQGGRSSGYEILWL